MKKNSLSQTESASYCHRITRVRDSIVNHETEVQLRSRIQVLSYTTTNTIALDRRFRLAIYQLPYLTKNTRRHAYKPLHTIMRQLACWSSPSVAILQQKNFAWISARSSRSIPACCTTLLAFKGRLNYDICDSHLIPTPAHELSTRPNSTINIVQREIPQGMAASTLINEFRTHSSHHSSDAP
jgi:hypothetical protein